MPKDLLRILLHEHSRATQEDMVGQIMSPVTLLPYDNMGRLMPVAHVTMNTPTGIVLICNVPVAANNQVMQHAALGSPVRLKRSRTGRLEIIGLDKRAPGTLYNYTLAISTGLLTSGHVSGINARALTYGELASATSGGYGQTPYGATGIFNGSSTLMTLV